MADFTVTLEDIGQGKVLARADSELAKVIEAVAETTKPGSVAVKITIKWENGMALLSGEVSSKVPQHGLPASLFYFGEKGEGTLHREDPRQLSLRNLEPAKPAPLRAIGGGKHEPEPEPTQEE